MSIQQGSDPAQQILVTLFNCDLKENQTLELFNVLSTTTVANLQNHLIKIYDIKEIQLFLAPNELFQGSINTLLLPILLQRKINQILFRISKEKPLYSGKQKKIDCCLPNVVEDAQVSIQDKLKIQQQQQNQNQQPLINQKYYGENIFKKGNRQSASPIAKTSMNPCQQPKLFFDGQNGQRKSSVDTIPLLNGKLKQERIEKEQLQKKYQQNEQEMKFQIQDIIQQSQEQKSLMENKILELNQQITRLQSCDIENQKLKTDIAELKKETKQVNNELELQKKINVDLQKQIKSLEYLKQQTSISELLTHNEQLIQKNIVLNQQYKVQEQQVNELITQYSSLKTVKIQLEQTIKQQEDQKEEYAELERRLEEVSQKYSTLQQDQESQSTNSLKIIQSLQSEVKDYQEKLEQQENLAKNVTNQLKVIQDEKNQISSQLDQLKQSKNQKVQQKGRMPLYQPPFK